MSEPKILRNRAQCTHCGAVVESLNVHDFVSCNCGRVFVDGGLEYLRRGFKEELDINELSVFDYAKYNGYCEDQDIMSTAREMRRITMEEQQRKIGEEQMSKDTRITCSNCLRELVVHDYTEGDSGVETLTVLPCSCHDSDAPLTAEQKKRYIEHGGVRCPYCESDNLTSSLQEVEVEFGGATQELECNDCNRCWSDLYKLVDLEERLA